MERDKTNCGLIRSDEEIGCELECCVILLYCYCHWYCFYHHYYYRERSLTTIISTGIVVGVVIKPSREYNGFSIHVILSFPLRVENKSHIALCSVELFYMEPSGGHFNKCGVLMSSLWF
jgi:hypothetical protein